MKHTLSPIEPQPRDVAGVWRRCGALALALLTMAWSAGAATNGLPYVTGDLVPDVPGATFTSFGVPAINKEGKVAFLGRFTSAGGAGAAIIADAKLVMKVGDLVSATASVKTLLDPVIDDMGNTAFLATLTGAGIDAGNATAVISNVDGFLRIVAQHGAPLTVASGPIPVWKSFTSVAVVSRRALIVGSIAGTGIGVGNDKVLVAAGPGYGADGSILLQTGTLAANGKVLKSFAVLKSVTGVPGQTRAFNATRLVYKAVFTDGTQALDQLDLP